MKKRKKDKLFFFKHFSSERRDSVKHLLVLISIKNKRRMKCDYIFPLDSRVDEERDHNKTLFRLTLA